MSLEFDVWPGEALRRFEMEARGAADPAGTLPDRAARALRSRIAATFPEWPAASRAAFLRRVLAEAQVTAAEAADPVARLHLLLVADAAVTVVEAPDEGGHGEEYDLRQPQQRRPVELEWLPDSGFSLTFAGRRLLCRPRDDRSFAFTGSERKHAGSKTVDVFGVEISTDRAVFAEAREFVVVTPPKTEIVWEWGVVGANSAMRRRPAGTRELAGIRVSRASLAPPSGEGDRGDGGGVLRLRGVGGAPDRAIMIRTAPAAASPHAVRTYVDAVIGADGRVYRRGHEETTVNLNRGGAHIGFGFPAKEIWLPLRRQEAHIPESA